MFSSNCRIPAAESRLSLELKTSPVEGLMQLGDEAYAFELKLSQVMGVVFGISSACILGISLMA